MQQRSSLERSTSDLMLQGVLLGEVESSCSWFSSNLSYDLPDNMANMASGQANSCQPNTYQK